MSAMVLNIVLGRRTYLFIVAALIVNAAAYYADAADSNFVGSVTKIHGVVELERNGRKSIPALSSRVLLEDLFRTNRSSSVTITLAGGSELQVGQSTSIRIDRDVLDSKTGARFTVIKLIKGKLHSLVPSLVTGGNFAVQTGNAISGVRGTEFETAYIEGKPCPGFPDCLRYTDVGVYSGTVEVHSLTNPQALPVRVSEGYETTVPCEVQPSSPSPLGAAELEVPGYR
ncbi:MAG: FecR domain-containing protein [Deltaproteobacteria bacterium]|nr:FecR domain-containing protein [Deltaproteobacteria bacterium]